MGRRGGKEERGGEESRLRPQGTVRLVPVLALLWGNGIAGLGSTR